MTQHNSSESDLTHYGVKGMHWGVRKARTGNLNKHAKSLERVAAGNPKFGDRGHAAMTVPIKSQLSKGFRKAAGAEAAKARAEIDRLANGRATALDILRAYGSVTLTQVIASARTKTDFVPKKG